MLRNKPRMNRRREISEEIDRQRRLDLMRRIEAELAEDEYLGEPFRAGIGIIIPIEVRRSADT